MVPNGLKGNPVKSGNGPAAVTLSFSSKKREPFWHLYTTVPINRDGKVAKRAGESEDLPLW